MVVTVLLLKFSADFKGQLGFSGVSRTPWVSAQRKGKGRQPINWALPSGAGVKGSALTGKGGWEGHRHLAEPPGSFQWESLSRAYCRCLHTQPECQP